MDRFLIFKEIIENRLVNLFLIRFDRRRCDAALDALHGPLKNCQLLFAEGIDLGTVIPGNLPAQKSIGAHMYAGQVPHKDCAGLIVLKPVIIDVVQRPLLSCQSEIGRTTEQEQESDDEGRRYQDLCRHTEILQSYFHIHITSPFLFFSGRKRRTTIGRPPSRCNNYSK